MKKFLTLSLCVLLAACLFVACSTPAPSASQTPDVSSASASEAPASNEGGDDSLQKIKDKGELILGLDDAFPPYGFKDTDGVVKGFDIDLATEVCKRLGVELKIQPIVWDTKVRELNDGNIDCIWNGFTITDELSSQLLFTDPYVRNRQIIVVKADSGINTKADLAGKYVGVQAGSSANEAIENEKDVLDSFKELVSMKDNVLGLTEVKNGTVDALVLDEAVGLSYIQDNPELKALDEDFGGEEYGIGFRLEDKALMEAVQSTLADMRADGTIAEIAAKWPTVTGAILD